MKNPFSSTVVTAGLAIFSMLFGAGNLMFPLQCGIGSGTNLGIGILGFLLTAVVLPVIGLITVILFNGDYKKFFARIGEAQGLGLILFSMLVIGPCIAMPRIVTLTYAMLSPFFPSCISLGIFSLGFCGLTFLATVRESKIIDLLGNFISPALLVSLSIILIKGMMNPQSFIPNGYSPLEVFLQQAENGYAHLDLLGGIFFGSIVLSILKQNATKTADQDYNLKTLAWTGMKSGVLGCVLLGIVYAGMALLGAYFGHEFAHASVADIFSLISFKVMGTSGALVIGTAVAMACFSTIIALATVLAEYLQHEVTNNKISYSTGLLITLGSTAFVAQYDLAAILNFSAPIINTFYPVIIVITLCNLAYKMWNFQLIKPLVALATVLSIYFNSGMF